MPRRATLSSYAGPMPRPVVPMALPPAARSRAWSRAMWYGMISGVAGLTFSRERTSTPASSSSAISFISAAGESTTPLPIRHSASSRRMPDGIRWSTVFLPPITSVWPALCPPWKRTTPPMSCVSRSTILPLPSSPHWAPITTTDWPMAACSLNGKKPAVPRAADPSGFCGLSRLSAPAASPGRPRVQPWRTHQRAARPPATTRPPMVRSWPSGVASICAIARFQAAGAAKGMRPSLTATRPRAAQRSLTRASPVVAEVLQERVVALQHHHRIARLEGAAVGVEAALEGEERGVAVGGLGIDARGLGVALASQHLGVALGLGQQHGLLAIGLGAHDPRLLLALGAQRGGHLAALGAHAVVDLVDHLAVGGQVDLLEADVHHLHAERARALVDAGQLAVDQLRAVARDQLGQRLRVDLVAQRFLDDRRQAVGHQVLVAAGG